MLKVDRNKYKNIKKIIDGWMAEGKVVTHKQQKRSMHRKQCYEVLGHSQGLSYETIQKIGRSKNYSDFRHMQWPQGKTHVKVRQVGPVRVEKVALRQPTMGDMVQLQNELMSLVDEVTQLQTEMAIIKNKKRRWFNG